MRLLGGRQRAKKQPREPNLKEIGLFSSSRYNAKPIKYSHTLSGGDIYVQCRFKG
jgi:hypothetical protein